MNILNYIATAAALAAVMPAQAAVEISSKPTSNMTCSAGVCSPTAKKAVLNTSDLAAMLANGDIRIQSSSIAQDIAIDAALSWTSTHRLTLDSYRAIAINKPVEVTGTGAVTIVTNDGGAAGDLQFFGKGHVEFWDVGSTLIINGQSYALASSIKQIAAQLEGGAAFVALAKNINAARHPYSQAPIADLTVTFEGLGNRIANLKVHESRTSNNAALISDVSSTGIVRDLNIDSADISGDGSNDQLVGAVAGNNDGVIANVRVTGAMTLNGEHAVAGGLAGESDGSILRCSANVSVLSIGQSNSIGGLLGLSYEVGDSHVGTIEESFSTGTVSAQNQDAINVNVGGLVGAVFGGRISNSYSHSATSDSSVHQNGNLETGGFVGRVEGGVNPPVSISNSYSTGTVNGSIDGSTGGFIGEDSDGGIITNTYWDIDTSGIDDPSKGIGNVANDPGVTGLTTAQFTSGLPSGFKKSVWREDAKVNDGYPYLIANPSPR